MRMMQLTRACLCSLAVTTIMAGRTTAEPVQATLGADAHTVGLWLFSEGQGNSSACAVKGPPVDLHGATWTPGAKALRWRCIPGTR